MISGHDFDRHFAVAELENVREKTLKIIYNFVLKKLSYITETVIVREFRVILRWLNKQNVCIDLVVGFVVMSGEKFFQESLGGDGDL
jgi:mannose/fructose/N-acetylgalactosamine-specific phosphotransferase system component IIC